MRRDGVAGCDAVAPGRVVKRRASVAAWAVRGLVVVAVASIAVGLALTFGTRVPTTASAAPGESSRTVVLRRSGDKAIPLHPADGSRKVSARAPSGSSARVLARSEKTRWLHVIVAGGARGWVSPRYVASASGPGAGAPPPAASVSPVDPRSPWHSPGACQRALASGQRRAKAATTARVGSWNVRWFPDGALGKGKHGERPTDVAWLACLVAWMQLDVLAVQEFRRTDAGRAKTSELLRDLDATTRGRWQARFDSCPGKGAQHVGFLFDASRVSAAHWQDLGSLNPAGAGCVGHLRPGLGAYFRFPGGLDAHVVNVHLKSGPKQRSYDLRRRSVAGLVTAYRERQGVAADADVLVAGDFNTMGCRDCKPALDPRQELAALDADLSALTPPMRRLEATPGCSEYYRGTPTLLDHFVVTRSMTELPPRAAARATGYCEALACGSLGASMPLAYRALSDHCPLLLDVTDRDDDR